MSGWLSRAKTFMKWLSVEPVSLLYYLSVYMSALGASNLYLQKTCSPLQQPSDTNAVCHDAKSIGTSTDVNTMRTVMRTCIPGVTVLLAGAWRDRTGLTRPLILLILFGEILATVVMLFGFFYWSVSPWVFGSIESVIAGLAGGQPLFSMACNCHIAENTPEQSRAARFSYYVGSVLIGGIISNAVGGLILSTLGYLYFFILIIALEGISIILAIVFIKDNPGKERNGQSLLKMSTLKRVFSRGENVSGIWMTIIASSAINSVVYGETNVFLYYMEQGFEYSVTQAGYVLSYRMAVEATCSIIISTILSNVLKINDYKAAIVCAVVTFISSIALTFSITIAEVCICIILGAFKPTLCSALRSSLSKFVKPQETGMFFGFESVCSAFLPAIMLPLYGMAFNATVDSLPGGYFLVSAALELVIIVFVCTIFWIYGRKKLCDSNKEDVEKYSQKCCTVAEDSDHFKQDIPKEPQS